MAVTRKVGSNLWACPWSPEVLHYVEDVKRVLGNTLYMQELNILQLLGFCQSWAFAALRPVVKRVS